MLVIGKLLLIQKPNPPNELEQLLSSLKALLILLPIEAIKLHNLMDLVTDKKL